MISFGVRIDMYMLPIFFVISQTKDLIEVIFVLLDLKIDDASTVRISSYSVKYVLFRFYLDYTQGSVNSIQ